MAYAYNEYTGTTDTDYTISFAGATSAGQPGEYGYLSEDHVHFYLNGELQDDSLRTFLSPLVIQIAAPLTTDVVRFVRQSSIETPMVDWASGAGVSAYNLDTNTLQMLYVAQEAADAGAIDLSDAITYTALCAGYAADTAADVILTAADVVSAAASAAYVASQVPNWELENDTSPTLGGDLALGGHDIIGVTDQGYISDLVDDTSPTLGGALDCNDLEVGKPLFKDSAETTQALGSISTATSISLASGNVATCTIGADLTFTFTDPPATGKTGILLLEVTNGGAYTITWPASVAWDGGTAPALQTSGVDIITFITRDAGTTWRAVRGWKEA